MSIDADDVKVLVRKTLQYAINSCGKWVKNHPCVSCALLFVFLLYTFLPSIFNILFYTSPLVIVAAIFLGGRFSFKNNDQQEDGNNTAVINVTSKIQVPKVSLNGEDRQVVYSRSRSSIGKDEINKGKGIEQLAAKSTGKNDLIHTRLIMREMPMKIREEKNPKCASSSSSSSSSRLYGRIANSVPSKLIDIDLSESDTECQEDDDDDEPQEETNKAVQWTEDDQRNLMDLGTSELERNRRLESLIAKRRARKLLSMQPIRRGGHLDLDIGYVDHQPPVVASIVAAARAVEDAEAQPGSAPSVLLPTRNPFDLPYDPSEEKPILTGGSFEEEFFTAHQKDFSFCRHESFIRGPGFTGDFNDDPITKLLPSFFPKPRTSDISVPGFSRFRLPSDMEENQNLLNGLLSQEGQVTEIQSDSHDEVDKLSPKREDQGNLADKGFCKVPDTPECNSDLLGDTEPDLVENKESEDAETKDMEVRVASIDDAGDEVSSSSSSSEASGDIINAAKNEAFRNSVRKVLTCLIPRNRRYSNEKIIGPSIEPQYDSSPNNNIHPTKMEERSFYTGRPFHTPTYSIASDMLVEVSEAGSPSFNAEPNSPTDRESLVYDGDVDKDVNSGDEDLWGASPHPVRLEEFGPRFRVNETGEEMGKSPLGLIPNSSHGLLGLPGQPERVSDPGANNEASSSSSTMSISLKESEPGLVVTFDHHHHTINNDTQQQVIADGEDLTTSAPCSFVGHLPDQVQRQTVEFIDNFVPLSASDAAASSCTAEEQQKSEKVIKQEDVDSNARPSHRNSISPTLQPTLVVELEPVAITLSSSPNSVLEETVIMDAAAASTSCEQNTRHSVEVLMVKNDDDLLKNLHQESHPALEEGKHFEWPEVVSTSSEAPYMMHNDGQHPDEVIVKGNNVFLNDLQLQQENPTALAEGNHLEQLTKPESDEVAAELVDLPKENHCALEGKHLERPSPRGNSLLSGTAAADEVSSTSSSTDQPKVDTESRNIGHALTMNDLQQEYDAVHEEGKHFEGLGLSKPSSPSGYIEATENSPQKAANESNINLREQVLLEEEEGKFIENGHYGSGSSSNQHDVAQSLLQKDANESNINSTEQVLVKEEEGKSIEDIYYGSGSSSNQHDVAQSLLQKDANESNINSREQVLVKEEEGKSIEDIYYGSGSSSSNQHDVAQSLLQKDANESNINSREQVLVKEEEGKSIEDIYYGSGSSSSNQHDVAQSLLQKDANESNINSMEQVLVKEEEGKFIENGHYGSGSSSNQHDVAQNSPLPAQEARGEQEYAEGEARAQQPSTASENNDSTLKHVV
ncbi:hypothetical protein Dimus_009219 [Dionaea muscipula]